MAAGTVKSHRDVIAGMTKSMSTMSYFCQKYVKNSGIGTVVALMLPFSIVFLVGWSILFVLFLTFDLPFGVGG